ncbi:MAG: hypothetical protein AAFU41_03785 [Pseudomonadota bacterium]
MQWKDAAQNWPEITPHIVSRWPALEESEVRAIDGDQERFLNYLAAAKNNDEVAAQMELADWLMTTDAMDAVKADNAQVPPLAKAS